MTATTFDPTRHLRKLNGRDYLEVVYRLQWLRSEHADAAITTKLEQVDFEAGWAIFHARVEIPGAGIAEGTGSETRQAFPAGWLEKAETVAVGRALAMLGYGTSLALADFEEGHLSDSPMERPATTATFASNGALATPAQLKLIYITAERDVHISGEQIEERCESQFGRIPPQLTRAEASALIDQLKKAGTNGKAR